MFLQVFCISAFARTLRKSSEHRFERAFRASHATGGSRKTISSVFGTPKWSPRSLQGALGSLLGFLWDPPGRQLDPLGALLGALWRLGGRSWALLATLLLANSRNFVCWTGFYSIWNPFGSENLRNSIENLRNPSENFATAPRIKRRNPTRVRRSREANSILEYSILYRIYYKLDILYYLLYVIGSMLYVICYLLYVICYMLYVI